MKRFALWSALLTIALATPSSAGSRTYFGFQIGIRNAPPPPPVVFQEAPDVVLVPNTSVYVVESPYDCDIFRYGAYYYVCDEGYWYRAHNYRGPFRVVDARYVPRPVYFVPPGQWKHHWKDMDEDDNDQGWHGHGHGHGHKHGHGDDDDQD